MPGPRSYRQTKLVFPNPGIASLCLCCPQYYCHKFLRAAHILALTNFDREIIMFKDFTTAPESKVLGTEDKISNAILVNPFSQKVITMKVRLLESTYLFC